MAKLELLKQVKERTGTQDSGSVTIRKIPVGEISVKSNIRVSESDITDLMQSIKSTGLLQPITVCKDGDDYMCILGHRRLQAFRELYRANKDLYHSIPAIITDDKDIMIRQLIENVQRVDLKPIELYHALKQLRAQGLKIKEISVVIGKAEGYVKNLFSGIKELESNPENMEIFKKSHDVTLGDFQHVKPVKDAVRKKELLNAKADKKITSKELQQKAIKKPTDKIIYQIHESEGQAVKKALEQVLAVLKPVSKGSYKGQVILSTDAFKALSGLAEQL